MKIKVWRDPDGLYLLKGGGPEVWRLFRIKKKWREAQASFMASDAASARTSDLLLATSLDEGEEDA